LNFIDLVNQNKFDFRLD